MEVFKQIEEGNVEDVLKEMFESTKQNMFDKYGMDLDGPDEDLTDFYKPNEDAK